MTRTTKTKTTVSTQSTPTKESVTKEAGAIGDSFTRVNYPSADVIAETTEMLPARADVKAFQARGYPVTTTMFDRLTILLALLTPAEAQQSMAIEDRKVKTAEAEGSRDRLLAIRDHLAAIGEAGGLLSATFTVDTARYDVLVTDTKEMIDKVRRLRAQMSDKAVVDALLNEAEALIDADAQSRAAANALADQKKVSTLLADQIKRLLVDQLRHISRQGLAAFPNDITRERMYRLERFAGRRSPKKKGDETEPVADDAVDS